MTTNAPKFHTPTNDDKQHEEREQYYGFWFTLSYFLIGFIYSAWFVYRIANPGLKLVEWMGMSLAASIVWPFVLIGDIFHYLNTFLEPYLNLVVK